MFEVPAGTDPSRYPKTRKQRKIPRSSTPATIKAVIGLFWIFMFLKFSAWYNTSLVLGDQYMKYGFLRRVWILEMLGLSTRMKYYGVWCLTEGACILSGMGYKGVDPKTGNVDWNRLQNVNPWGIESAQNSRAYLENWNMNTNNWLRNYMYLRVTPKGKKPGFRASLATFITSAFWHGFYPGYYLSFILAAFLQTIAKSESREICFKAIPIRLTVHPNQISAAMSVPSSSHQTASTQRPTNHTTTSSPTSPRKRPSALPPRPSSSSPSPPPSSSGPGSTSTPSSARQHQWPSSPRPQRHGSSSDSGCAIRAPHKRRKSGG